ncbi:MAG: FAD-binding oxidoreductase [Actinomycetia bacterium]|nr:FAD-binding oxidoreductase [Actinomycetes bacterium]
MIDFGVIGGGIAGVSAAAHLGPHGSVILLEMESVLSYHSTGRSAAMFRVNYPDPGPRALARASRRFLEDPPAGSTDAPLLTDRGLLWVAAEIQMPGLGRGRGGGTDPSAAGSRLLSAKEVNDMVPVMRREQVAGGLNEPTARDLDVAGLHQAFVRIARRHEVEIRTATEVTAIRRTPRGWTVTAGGVLIECRRLVNAAGAWGDHVAELAGVAPIGLQAFRRTVFMVPGRADYANWPMVVDADRRFYFKPDGVQLLCSCVEEVLSAPMDTRPRSVDVARAIECINQATTIRIRSVNSAWTGLRTFAADREVVIGEDPAAPGFFWLVGQGGTGIRTSPACGQILASQMTSAGLSSELVDAGVDPAMFHPARLRGQAGERC